MGFERNRRLGVDGGRLVSRDLDRLFSDGLGLSRLRRPRRENGGGGLIPVSEDVGLFCCCCSSSTPPSFPGRVFGVSGDEKGVLLGVVHSLVPPCLGLLPPGWSRRE